MISPVLPSRLTAAVAITSLIAPLLACASAPELPARLSHLDISACPVVANVAPDDLAAMLAMEPVRDLPGDELNSMDLPTNLGPIPHPDAVVVVRARVPPGGGSSRDDQAVIWRDANGTWSGWRRSPGGQAGSPPPPPRPGSPEAEGFYYGPFDSWPDRTGVIEGEARDRLEHAFREPCRQLEPDFWPRTYRLKSPEDGVRRRDCPIHPDSTVIHAEISEPGRSTRRVSIGCGPSSWTAVLVTGAAYVELPSMPLRRLKPGQNN